MNCLRMSFLLQSDIPIRYKLVVFFGPASQEIGERGPVDHSRDSVIDLPPQVLKRRIGPALRAGLPILAAFKKAVHLADRDRAGWPGEQVSPFRASAGFHKSTLFQAGQDQL